MSAKSGANKVYDNCLVVDPNNKPLSFVNNKKRRWYLEKNLAELICEEKDKSTIKLKFFPNIRKNIEYRDLVPKENKCICCESIENLSRHHVVPFVFLKHFPTKYKKYKSDFIVCLCLRCHRKYEKKVFYFKNDLGKKYGVMWEGRGGEYSERFVDFIKKWRGFNILLYGRHSEEEKSIIKEELKSFGYSDFSKEAMLKYIIDLIPTKEELSRKVWHKKLAEEVVSRGEDFITEFILLWFNHFVDNMKPKFNLNIEETVNGNRP